MKENAHKQPIQHCPYCGTRSIYYKRGATRCFKCRRVFNVQFDRFMRKSPSCRVDIVNQLVGYLKRHDGIGVLLNAEA